MKELNKNKMLSIGLKAYIKCRKCLDVGEANESYFKISEERKNNVRRVDRTNKGLRSKKRDGPKINTLRFHNFFMIVKLSSLAVRDKICLTFKVELLEKYL